MVPPRGADPQAGAPDYDGRAASLEAGASRVTYLTGLTRPVNRPGKTKKMLVSHAEGLCKYSPKAQIPSVAATCRKSGSFACDRGYLNTCYHCGKGPNWKFSAVSADTKQTVSIGPGFATTCRILAVTGAKWGQVWPTFAVFQPSSRGCLRRKRLRRRP